MHWIEMHILRVDKMSLLFKMSLWPHQRGTVLKQLSQIKDIIVIIFPLIPCESMWVPWWGQHTPAKLAYYREH